MDTIFLKRLTVEAIVGVFAWEKRIPQKLTIDLEMGTDIAKSAASDDLQDTIDYKAVSKYAQEFIKESRYDLVETLAHRLAEALMSEFSIPYLRMKLSKIGAVRNSNAVGIVIERGTRK